MDSFLDVFAFLNRMYLIQMPTKEKQTGLNEIRIFMEKNKNNVPVEWKLLLTDALTQQHVKF